MFHEMRRSNMQLPKEEAEQILQRERVGVLSTVGVDGYPYGVPMSYAYADGVLYFHGSSQAGHKMENINFQSKACFTVISNEQAAEQAGRKYESIIAFGQIQPAADRQIGLQLLREKYRPEYKLAADQPTTTTQSKTIVYEFRVEYLTGKAKKK